MKTDFKKMSELDVIRLAKNENVSERVRDAARAFLYKKYEEMIHRHWWLLQKSLNESDLVNNAKEEYYSEAQIAFFNALEKVDLSKIYDENFKLMQLASWYIGNSRKKVASEIVNKRARERSLLSVSDSEEVGTFTDPEIEFSEWEENGYKQSPEYLCELHDSEKRCNSVVEKYLKIWDPLKVEIFRRRKLKESRVEISEALNIPITKIYKCLKEMYNDLSSELIC